MKRLYIGEALHVEAIRSLLAQAGIAATVFNQPTGVAVGDIPFTVSQPELWIAHDRDEPRAREIAKEYLARRDAGCREERPPWRCPRCGGMVDGQFTDCWRCATGEEGTDPRLDPQARCVKCGRSLYGLTERRCPQCGKEF
jgi:predicted RNA-binding Zn-ribbon protein involved in translation (DUF1610 family)